MMIFIEETGDSHRSSLTTSRLIGSKKTRIHSEVPDVHTDVEVDSDTDVDSSEIPDLVKLSSSEDSSHVDTDSDTSV